MAPCWAWVAIFSVSHFLVTVGADGNVIGQFAEIGKIGFLGQVGAGPGEKYLHFDTLVFCRFYYAFHVLPVIRV